MRVLPATGLPDVDLIHHQPSFMVNSRQLSSRPAKMIYNAQENAINITLRAYSNQYISEAYRNQH